MKKILYSIMLVAMTALMCVLPSCGGDDDEPDIPKVDSSKKGWFKADGKTTEFNYGYTLDETDSEDVEIMFTTFNMLELYTNPKKFIGKKLSSMAFYKGDGYTGFGAHIDIKLIDVYYEEGEWVAIGEDGKGYESDYDNFTFNVSSGSYSISGSALNAKCWTEDRYGNEQDLGTAKVDFGFSGVFKDLSSDPNDYSDTRSVEIVKITDPKVVKFIRSIAYPRTK